MNQDARLVESVSSDDLVALAERLGVQANAWDLNESVTRDLLREAAAMLRAIAETRQKECG